MYPCIDKIILDIANNIAITITMYIDKVPNRNSRPTLLLRKARREGKIIKKTTLDNLTNWPPQKVELLRRVLRDEALVPVGEAFATERSLPHGHVEAVLGTIRKLGLDKLISSKRCRERDLTVAMVAEQLIHPCSKLATTRLWHTTTLAQELKVEDADEDELYEAMDWLLRRQGRIEKKLAKRHLCDGSLVLYDLTSSYYEGRTCPLVRFGHDHDGKKGTPIIVYGVLTDEDGRPIAVEVYPGDTGDPTTVSDRVKKLRRRFGLSRVVLVRDRGMPTQLQMDDCVRAHVFIYMLSYYVEWHMRKALAPLLFDDEELDEQRKKRDPVAPARQSASAKRKKTSRRTPTGFPVHSFETLMEELGTICRNRCRIKSDPSCPTFRQLTEPTPLQVRALQLLGLYPVSGN